MERSHDDAPIDIDKLMAMTDGDRALIRECLAEFSNAYNAMIAAVREAAFRGDGEALEKSAHTLKGSLADLAAGPAAAAASELEKSGHNRAFFDLESKLAALELECGKLWAFIEGLRV